MDAAILYRRRALATQGGSKYLQQLCKSAAELESGVKSFKAQIAKHTGWIADPLTKMPDFYLIDTRRQKALLVGRQQDIDRHLDCIAILRGVLKQENKPEFRPIRIHLERDG